MKRTRNSIITHFICLWPLTLVDMAKHFRPTDFDSHPPDVYGSVTARSQRDGFLSPEQCATVGSLETTASSGKYMPLLFDTPGDDSNEYDYIPCEKASSPGGVCPPVPPSGNVFQPTGSSSVAGTSLSGSRGGGRGSSFRGGEQKITQTPFTKTTLLLTRT